MAGVLQKLIRKSSYSSLRTITSFYNSPQSSNIAVPLLFHQPNPIDFKPVEDDDDGPNIVNPILGSSNNGKSSLLSPSSFQIYPSFPFGYSLNPNLLCGVVNQLEEQVVMEESGGEKDTKTVVWADSVKKKRKKKMNKHKYKKLRKRLRRQT